MPNATLDANISQQIQQTVALLEKTLGTDLLGVCLYGSAVIGGLQRYSDIDLLAVCERRTSREEKKDLANALLDISGVYRSSEKRPIELTLLVRPDVNPWRYPPRFDFQYGDWLRDDFESGNVAPWQTAEKPGLALMMTQVLLASRTVYGQEAARLMVPVPYTDVMKALVAELESVRADLAWDVRNVLLTLARIWWTIEKDSITSKQTAGRYAIEQLPEDYRPVLHRALDAASGEREERWDDLMKIVPACADFMATRIREKMADIAGDENSTRRISLAEVKLSNPASKS